MNGTGTMWIAWDCQSSQQLPNINYSSLRRSCVLSSPFQRAAPRHCESGAIRPGSSSRSVARLGWEPAQGLCVQPRAPDYTRVALNSAARAIFL